MQSLTEMLGKIDGQAVWMWVEALGVAALVAVSLRLVLRVVRRRLHRVAQRTTTRLDDVIVDLLSRTKTLFILALGVAVAVSAFPFPARLEKVVLACTWLIVFFQLGLWGSALVQQIIRARFAEANLEPATRSGTAVVSIAGVTVVWGVVILLALDNLGINVTTLIAGLGVGGVAIALATQNILGDLFASVSILLDKPFVLGDFIVVGDFLGTVEHIGIKTTRVRSLSGEQLIFSNNDLLQSRIRNYKRMQERRVVFMLRVVYQTPAGTVERIPSIIRKVIEALPNTRFDRSHFLGYDDCALQFETVFYVLSADYNVYMDLRQQMNLEIFRIFRSEGIELAYPTRSLFVEGVKQRPDADPLPSMPAPQPLSERK